MNEQRKMERTGSIISSAFRMGRGSKKKTKPKQRRNRKSTPLMQKHHHATFAHLVHDALLRLNCAPNPTQGGASKKSIAHNIERHYKMKLGRKFDKRLRLSLTRLVNQGKLVRSRNKSARYNLSPGFKEHFKRLRVIHGDANQRHGVPICRSPHQHSRSRSNSRTRGKHKKKRSLYSFFSRFTRRRKKSRSRSRQRSRSRARSKSRSRSKSKSRHSSKSRRNQQSGSGRKKSEKGKSRSQSSSSTRVSGSKKGSIASWFWPAASSAGSTSADHHPTSPSKAALAAPHIMEQATQSNRRLSPGLGRMFRRFKRGRSRERASRSRDHRSSSRPGSRSLEGRNKSQHSLGPLCRCKAFPLPHHHRPSNPTVPYPSTTFRSRSRSKPRVTKVSSLIDNMETSEHEESGPGKDYNEDAHNAKQTASSCQFIEQARSNGRYINAPLTSRLKSLLQE